MVVIDSLSSIKTCHIYAYKHLSLNINVRNYLLNITSQEQGFYSWQNCLYMLLLFDVQTLIIVGNVSYFDESVNQVSVGNMSDKMRLAIIFRLAS